MPFLDSDLRRQLENVIIEARDVAEAAARSALQKRAVDVAEPFPHFGPEEKELRNRLRARGRQVGDVRRANGTQALDRLTQELAYESWHRMLFARFLAENHLLMHPDGVAVSLEECDELAPAETPPAPNGFVLAARYASRMLPQIFRTDDVLLEIEFAPEQRLALEKLLASLPQKTFRADDSLGWVYQFWQTREKERVNKSGNKIDGSTLPAVTQLFTEHYMVEFLLHNTIGAWWAAKEGVRPRIKHGSNTDEKIEYQNGIDPCSIRVPSLALPEFTYLRWRDDGTPAAGTFEGWPKSLARFTMLDPCCGSGHFLVAAFHLLVPLRMHDEGLTAKEACEAVLRENLFGLELDPRCTQIAAFALALAAWAYPGEDGQPLGYRPLPPLNIACSGQGVVGSKEDWTRFANGDARFREGMERLYDLFRQAPTLGSLIDPRTVGDDLFALGFATLKGTLHRTLKKLEGQADPDHAAVGVAAQGIAFAASLMAREFTLVATNVPYLARGKQGGVLRDYIAQVYPAAKADLATAFVERCLDCCAADGSVALISPQNWWFLSSYEAFRTKVLSAATWRLVATLGEEAWQTFGIRGPKTTLLIANNSRPSSNVEFYAVNAVAPMTPEGKDDALRRGEVYGICQADQLQNPDARIVNEPASRGGSERSGSNKKILLVDYADSFNGMTIGDQPRLKLCFWEVSLSDDWIVLQSTTGDTLEAGGLEHVLYWCDGKGPLDELPGGFRRGEKIWGKHGIVVSPMRDLPVTRYFGHGFDVNVSVIVPRSSTHLNRSTQPGK